MQKSETAISYRY